MYVCMRMFVWCGVVCVCLYAYVCVVRCVCVCLYAYVCVVRYVYVFVCTMRMFVWYVCSVVGAWSVYLSVYGYQTCMDA